MTWVIVQEGRILYRGSREECMAAAERFGLLFHVGSELDDTGEPRGVLVDGRHWHPDGTELPCRIARGTVMMLERMLPRRLRRIAA
ncbi:hypothetical protein [uncultured Variovorax sp.]|uniref:hypothetical protein n=1 Tax=uncultured Variovorax sp. TaxID=114708 RepID=UPI002610C5FE|nr:hypothetical protein [uncultured Variovorax sp.]